MFRSLITGTLGWMVYLLCACGCLAASVQILEYVRFVAKNAEGGEDNVRLA